MLSEVVAAIKEKAGGAEGSVPNWESGVKAFGKVRRSGKRLGHASTATGVLVIHGQPSNGIGPCGACIES